jgi:hypothetical protein
LASPDKVRRPAHAEPCGCCAQSVDPDVRPPIDAVVSQLAAITAILERQQPQPSQHLLGGPPVSPHAAAAAAARALTAAPQAFSPYDILFAAAK